MKTKICGKCGIPRPLKDFTKNKSKKSGFNNWCKECQKKYRQENSIRIKSMIKKWEENHKDYHKNYNKKHFTFNKGKYKKRRKEWYEKNKDKINKKSLKYYYDNIDKIKARSIKYREKNKTKIRESNKKYRETHKEYDKERINNYLKLKRKNDPVFRLNKNISGGIYRSLKNGKGRKHWEDLVGYKLEDLKKHLECQFKEGMTWENYGKSGWEVDHRVPLSIFNIKGLKSKGFKDAWKLENLQPLWQKENLEKRNKLFY